MTRAEWDAMAPDARDEMVAEKVMGWVWHDRLSCWVPTPNAMLSEIVSANGFQPTTDIAAAWEVVEKMREHPDAKLRTLRMVAYSYNRTYAVFGFHDGDPEWSEANGEHATPEAICIAALVAVGEIEP